MTDRYNVLTVVLEKDTRDDDAQPIIDAIGMVKGVLSVTPNVVNLESYASEMRARQDLQQKLWDILAPSQASP